MKTIWNIIKKFFGSIRKYSKLEDAVKTDLQEKYRLYQNKNYELFELVQLVDFCNRVKINGETEGIKAEILKEWEIKRPKS